MAARHLVSISLGSYSRSGANLEFEAGEQTAYSPSTEADVSSPRFLFHFEVDRPAVSIAQQLRPAPILTARRISAAQYIADPVRLCTLKPDDSGRNFSVIPGI